MNLKKKLWEALDIITNSLSHKQIVFQRNKSLESGVPYYVFRLTSLELKNIYLLLVSGHWPWCRGDPQKLWSFMVFMLEQPKIRPRIHNGRSSYMQYVYIYPMYHQHLWVIFYLSQVATKQMPIVWSQNLSSKFDSVTSKCHIALQVTSMWSIIPRRILTSPHFGVYKTKTALNMSHLRPFERGTVL